MPKQADIRVHIPGCTAAHFWDVVYENPEATESYHTRFNSSTETTVGAWSSCQRTVNFTMPVRLPDFVKRMVGLDSVAVTEVQRAVWRGGGSFTVASETAISNMMGAGRFTTALQLTVTEEHEQGPQAVAEAVVKPSQTCGGATAAGGVEAGAAASVGLQLLYSVRCAASSVPWPMSATIENIMAEKALVSMQSFLDHCTQLLDERAAVDSEAAAAAASSAATTTAVNDITTAPPAAGKAASPAGSASLDTVASLGGCLTPPPPVAAAAAGATGASGESFTGASTGAAAPTPLSPGHSLTLQPSRVPSSLRHRWPSITCSHDIGLGPGHAGGGDPLLLRRQETLGGAGDVWWDAPEAFSAANGGSGYSSGVVSPRQMGLASGTLRRLSGDHAGGGGGALLPHALSATSPAAGGGAGASSGAAAVAVGAVANETHHVVVSVSRLAEAVAALDRKLDKLLVLQQQQEERLQQQQQQQAALLRDVAAAASAGGGGGGGGPSSRRGAAAGLSRRSRGSRSSSRDSDADRDREGGDGSAGGGGGSDTRWLLRIAIAVMLATCLLLGFWVLHPHATGFKPHGGGDGGGGGDSPSPLPQPSVFRVDGGGGVESGGSAATAAAATMKSVIRLGEDAVGVVRAAGTAGAGGDSGEGQRGEGGGGSGSSSSGRRVLGRAGGGGRAALVVAPRGHRGSGGQHGGGGSSELVGQGTRVVARDR